MMKKHIIFIACLIFISNIYPCYGLEKNSHKALGLNVGKTILPSYLPQLGLKGWPANKIGISFNYKLTRNLEIQIETSYAIGNWSVTRYSDGIKSYNRKLTNKQKPSLEPSILLSPFKSKKIKFYTGIGFGYHRYEMIYEYFEVSSDIFEKIKTNFLGVTINYFLGIDFPITSHLWLSNQLKYKTGVGKYHVRYKNDDLDTYHTQSLNSNELTIGLKYTF